MKKFAFLLNNLMTFIFIIMTFSSCGMATAWIWGGVRFTPDDAIEAVGKNFSKWERIDTEEYYFYCNAVGENKDWIGDVIPVQQNGVGMYAAITNLNKYTGFVTVESTDEAAGRLLTLEGENYCYNFFLPDFIGYDPLVIPAFLNSNYENIQINGECVEIYKHSYFITEEKIQSFLVGEEAFIVEYSFK